MTRYSTESAADLLERIGGTARRNPEALLVIAAGCALLLRNRSSRSRPTDMAYRDYDEDFAGAFDELEDDEEASFAGAASSHLGAASDRAEGAMGDLRGAAEDARDRASEAGERLSRSAGAYRDRISRTAGEYYDSVGDYASAAAGYASEQGRWISGQARRFGGRAQSAASHVWHDQPLAVVGVGLAAGAALAALIPPSDAERRALRPAREAFADAASAGYDRVRRAASEAAHHVQDEIEERGLSPSGLKDIAREAADTFVAGVKDAGEEAEDAARKSASASSSGGSGSSTAAGSTGSASTASRPSGQGTTGSGGAKA